MGGFVGAISRYALSGLVQDLSRSISFPYGTLTVNLIGCLVIGGLAQLAEVHGALSAEARWFLLVGILGSFATFSTFGNETVNLMREGGAGLALVNVGAHIFLGIAAVFAGRLLTYQIWR